jgi:hypothetical protein
MIDVADLSPWLWLLAPLVVMIGYTVFGLSGFGSTAITVPILAHFLPVSYLVPSWWCSTCSRPRSWARRAGAGLQGGAEEPAPFHARSGSSWA